MKKTLSVAMVFLLGIGAIGEGIGGMFEGIGEGIGGIGEGLGDMFGGVFV